MTEGSPEIKGSERSQIWFVLGVFFVLITMAGFFYTAEFRYRKVEQTLEESIQKLNDIAVKQLSTQTCVELLEQAKQVNKDQKDIIDNKK